MSRYDGYWRYAKMMTTIVRLGFLSKSERNRLERKGLMNAVIPK